MSTMQERLQDVRKEAGLGQKEIAAALGITQQQYSLYETGKRTIPADILKDICKILNVSADYILGLPENKK